MYVRDGSLDCVYRTRRPIRPASPTPQPVRPVGENANAWYPAPSIAVQRRPSSSDQSAPFGPTAIHDEAECGAKATTDRKPLRPETVVHVAPPSLVAAALSMASDSLR